jgi:arylsulfatase A-like enzyme
MVYSPINPHDICFRFLDRFYGGKRDYPVVLPPNFEPTEAPAIKTVRDFKEFAWTKRVIPKDKQEWEEYLKFYCYLLEDVDRSLGRVLDSLATSGQMDHTIIVFTSDHGEMAGSHGMVHKGHSMYEENLRIPLWIADPRAPQGFRQSDALVSNLDLPATLAGLLGLAWPGPLSGVDLSPFVRGEKNFALTRDHVFAEGALRPEIAWRGVRTNEWKYWHYTNGEELLFHISDDPLEMKNLAADQNARDLLLKFRSTVQSWRRETKDPDPGFIS